MVEEEFMRTRRRRSRLNEKELAAQLHARRNDPDEWDDTPVQAEVTSQRAVVMSVRLPMAEFIAVRNAAKASGETVSEYVRNAIGMRLHERVIINAVQITSGAAPGSSQATFLAPALEGGRTRNPGPDSMPPLFANITG